MCSLVVRCYLPGAPVTVIACPTIVLPGVTSDVIVASEWYVPLPALLEMSNPNETDPPAVGGEVEHAIRRRARRRRRRRSLRSSRHGSRRPSSGPSPDRRSRRYRRLHPSRSSIEISSLDGPVPAAPVATRSQISNECVVALPKFLILCQSITIQVEEPSVSVPIRTPAPGAAGRVEVAPERRDHVVRPGRVREVLRREDDVGTVAATEHDVAVRHDPEARIRLAAVEERRHVEVRDRVVSDARDRRDAEQRERQVAARRGFAGERRS